MSDNRMEQLDALTTLAEFNERLLKNLPIIAQELSGEGQEDTEQYFQSVIDAINWEIAVVNATLDVLNEDKVRLDKEAFNQAVLNLNSAMTAKDSLQIAGALENLIPHFEQLGAAAKEVIQ